MHEAELRAVLYHANRPQFSRAMTMAWEPCTGSVTCVLGKWVAVLVCRTVSRVAQGTRVICCKATSSRVSTARISTVRQAVVTAWN